jgi:hypothetical protein
MLNKERHKKSKIVLFAEFLYTRFFFSNITIKTLFPKFIKGIFSARMMAHSKKGTHYDWQSVSPDRRHTISDNLVCISYPPGRCWAVLIVKRRDKTKREITSASGFSKCGKKLDVHMSMYCLPRHSCILLVQARL